MQGHKDNHAGLMTVAQMEKWRAAQNIRPGHEWEKFEGLSQDPADLEAFLTEAQFNAEGRRRLTAPVIEVPERLVGVLKCPNPTCVTNHESMASVFERESSDPLVLRCHYCERRASEPRAFAPPHG